MSMDEKHKKMGAMARVMREMADDLDTMLGEAERGGDEERDGDVTEDRELVGENPTSDPKMAKHAATIIKLSLGR